VADVGEQAQTVADEARDGLDDDEEQVERDGDDIDGRQFLYRVRMVMVMQPVVVFVFVVVVVAAVVVSVLMALVAALLMVVAFMALMFVYVFHSCMFFLFVPFCSAGADFILQNYQLSAT